MRPIDGFLRTLFITSKAVARHMGRERPGVILTLSEPGAKLAVGGIWGHGVELGWQGGVLAASGRGAGTQRHPGHRHPSTRCYRCAGSGFLHQGPLQTTRGSGRAVGPGIPRGRGMAGDALKRLPTLSEIAETAAFLASDRALEP